MSLAPTWMVPVRFSLARRSIFTAVRLCGMRAAIGLVGLCCLAGTAVAAPDSVVIARATDERGGAWVPCGGFHSIGWVVYERIRLVEGADPGARFVVAHSCPEYARLRGELRLVLQRHRPSSWPEVTMPGNLPQFWAQSATPEVAPETKRARRWLGLDRAAVDGALTTTSSDGEWTLYGPHLALRFDQGRVVAVRAHLATGLECEAAAEWLGFVVGGGHGFPLHRRDGCEWPGLSDRHRLAPNLSARFNATTAWFELTAR